MTSALVASMAFVILALIWTMLSQPQLELKQRTRADGAEAKVAALSTEIAILKPTAQPCRGQPPYFTTHC